MAATSRPELATARSGHRPRWDWEENTWWALYRKEMPQEDYASLSKTQRASRRRRFLKALTGASTPGPGGSACETGGGVSDETVRRG